MNVRFHQKQSFRSATIQENDGHVCMSSAFIFTQADNEILFKGLHSLKGDLMVFDESEELQEIIKLIGSMRIISMPEDFAIRWKALRAKT